jgi:hypothetical protein
MVTTLFSFLVKWFNEVQTANDFEENYESSTAALDIWSLLQEVFL